MGVLARDKIGSLLALKPSEKGIFRSELSRMKSAIETQLSGKLEKLSNSAYRAKLEQTFDEN